MNTSTTAAASAPLPRSAPMVGGAQCATLALALACLALPAGAATITVAAGAVAVANNGICSLREAIHNANADAQVDNTDCLAGSGGDTIQLAAASNYTLPDADPVDASNGLPQITSTILIEGNGATIERGGNLACTLHGTLDAAEFRLLRTVSPANLTLRDLTLRNGCIDGPSNNNFGGVIRNGAGATMTIVRSAVVGSAAGSGGAGGIDNAGTLTVLNSTVQGNTALGQGGGIRNQAGGVLQLDFVTISGNAVAGPPSGGGIGNAGTLTVKNSIVAGNYEGGDCVNLSSGTFTALGENLDEDGTCVALDADFTRVTATQLALAPPSFSPGAPALLPLFGSVAVDAVTDCTRIDGSTTVTVDQLGTSRPQDGDSTPGAACDIGAVEREGTIDVHHVGGACTLADAILTANTDEPVGGCTDSDDGSDLLILDADATLTAADTANSTLQGGAYAGLPNVTSEIVIAAGTGSVIERDPSYTCATADQSDEFRLLNVTSGGNLTLVGLTVRNGCADAGGGVLVLDSKLAVLAGTFSGNTARSTSSNPAEPARGGAVALEGASAASSFHGAVFTANVAANPGNFVFGGAIAAGGLYVVSGPVEVRNCAFEGNTAGPGAYSYGGAMGVSPYISGATISGSTFSSNQATGGTDVAGGAFDGALAVLANTRFIDNQSSGPGSQGGAVRIRGGNRGSWLSGLVFEGNAATGRGGALYAPSRLILTRTRFVGNVVLALAGDYVDGGAMYAEGGPSIYSDVTFEGNLAQGGAGVDATANGRDATGGGLALNGGQASLTNVTFTGNRASGGNSINGTGGDAVGGGLFADADEQDARFLTFADNQAIAGTGGAGNGLAAGGGLLVDELFAIGSSVFEGNTATVGGVTTGSDCVPSGGGQVDSLGFNTAGGATACTFAATGDQVGVGSSLLALGDHGCLVTLPDGSCLPTMPVRMSAPALDQGSCFAGSIGSDARGFPRPWDAPGVANAIDGCDAGAYESRDGDADGVEDWVDNCPFVANATQLDRDIPLDGVVALWRLDAGQGANIGDGYGAHDGTLTGNPQWVSGIAGAALAFDGVGDGVIIPHDAAFNPGLTEDFSVTAWVRLPASQAQTLRTTNLIVGKDQEGGTGFPFPWVLRVFNHTASASAIGHLQGARSDGTVTRQVVSTSRVDDGRWHHAAYIKRGSVLEMWVDGVLEASAADTTTVATGNTRFVGIGQREAASAKLDLRGSVDEVLYMASALSGAQVLDLYQRRGLAGDDIGTACDCDDADPTNTSAVCVNLFASGFE